MARTCTKLAITARAWLRPIHYSVPSDLPNYPRAYDNSEKLSQTTSPQSRKVNLGIKLKPNLLLQSMGVSKQPIAKEKHC